MAYIPFGILGDFSGKIGNIVGCICKNRSSYIRTRPMVYHDAKTAEQLRNRATMKTVMAFMSKAKVFAKCTFAQAAVGMTTTNVATKLNYHKVTVEGVEEVRMDYRRVRLSVGKMMVLDSAVVLKEEGRLMLRWLSRIDTEYSGMMDWVHVFVYNEDRHAEMTMLEACRRRDEELELRVPEKWKEEMLHVYVAVSDAREREFGNSQYFGLDGRREVLAGVGETFLEKEGVKGEVCGGDEEVKLEKINRFEGATGSRMSPNSVLIAMEQSAIKVLPSQYQNRIGKGVGKGAKSEEKGAGSEEKGEEGVAGGGKRAERGEEGEKKELLKE